MILLHSDSIILMLSVKAWIPWSHFPAGYHRCHWAGFQNLPTILKWLLCDYNFLTVLKLVVVVVLNWLLWQGFLALLTAFKLGYCGLLTGPTATGKSSLPRELAAYLGAMYRVSSSNQHLILFVHLLLSKADCHIGRWRMAPLMWQSTRSLASSRWQSWRWKWDDNGDKEWWKQRS